MTAVLCFVSLLALVSAETKPNVLFVMLDDVGWADMSWTAPSMATPVFEELRSTGASLDHAYVTHRCTSTRSTFMTGYFPHRVGTQHGIFGAFEPVGVPLDFTFISERFKELGYDTYAIGKWHLGYCKKEYTPLERGFDNFVGYYSGGNDQYTHTTSGKSNIGTIDHGYDMRWNWDVYYEANGTYTTHVFRDAALTFLDAQDQDTPFFMYMPFRTPHPPLEAPDEYYAACDDELFDEKRQKTCAMINSVDTAVGTIVQKLKDRGLYENTIIIVQSDNGGDNTKGGYNYPLRGKKGTVYEGGTRTPAFIHSPDWVTPGARNGVVHVVDWYKTLLSAAGYDFSSDVAFDDMDSEDLWSFISTGEGDGRSEMVYNIDSEAPEYAIRYGNYKYVINGGSGERTGWTTPPEFGNGTSETRTIECVRCNSEVFDLETDPYETTDIQGDDRQLWRTLQERMEFYQSQEVTPLAFDEVEEGNPANFGNFYDFGWC